MELYTLTSRFLPKESINELISVIWTERYSSAGDVQLVVPATSEMIKMLAPGTFLGLRGTMEIMYLETHSIENRILTVTGVSMPQYLNQRAAWFGNPAYDGTDTTVSLVSEFVNDTMTAGQFVSYIVNQMAIVFPGFAVGTHWYPINIDYVADHIPGLELGAIDANGTAKRFTFPLGPLYDGVQQIAREEGLGIKLYLRSASYDSGFVFKFATYRGKDRTSEQDVHQMVRLTPLMDSLTDVKELGSISQYKNVFYVNYKNAVSIHYIPGLSVPTGFDRRVMTVEAPDVYFNPALPDYAAKVAAFREQVARNTIANHIYIQAVDGNASAKIPYTYGVDYGLGDIIELQGYTGTFSKARISEYIRSEDQFGEREYPTLEVLDPVFIGYMPDLEPSDDFDEWYSDPEYSMDEDSDAWDDPEHAASRDPSDTDDNDGSQDEDPNPEPDAHDPEADFTWEIG